MATAGSKQAAVAASHQRKPLAHQADHPVAQRRGFPGIGGDTACAEETVCDDAVARAIQMAVERAQGRGQVVGSAGAVWLSSSSAVGGVFPEPDSRFGTVGCREIQGEIGRRSSPVRHTAVQPHLVPDAVVADDHVDAIGSISANDIAGPFVRRKSQSVGAIGRGRQQDDSRVFVGMPEDGGLIGTLARISQEIATPSGARL